MRPPQHWIVLLIWLGTLLLFCLSICLVMSDFFCSSSRPWISPLARSFGGFYFCFTCEHLCDYCASVSNFLTTTLGGFRWCVLVCWCAFFPAAFMLGAICKCQHHNPTCFACLLAAAASAVGNLIHHHQSLGLLFFFRNCCFFSRERFALDGGGDDDDLSLAYFLLFAKTIIF